MMVRINLSLLRSQCERGGERFTTEQPCHSYTTKLHSKLFVGKHIFSQIRTTSHLIQSFNYNDLKLHITQRVSAHLTG